MQTHKIINILNNKIVVTTTTDININKFYA